MSTEPETMTLNPRVSAILGGFLLTMIVIGAAAWCIGIIGWAILTWQQVIS